MVDFTGLDVITDSTLEPNPRLGTSPNWIYADDAGFLVNQVIYSPLTVIARAAKALKNEFSK
jgi:hypothetical protein